MAGKSHRKGISLAKISQIFATEDQAREWLENRRWTKGVSCPFCKGKNVVRLKHPTQTHRCKDCRNKKTKNQFNVKTDTVMEHSNIPCRIWAIGIYLYTTNIKGISSMKLHRELGIGQKAAWFMLHRLRKASSVFKGKKFVGKVEVDETYIGGKRKNMSNEKREALKDSGRGTVGKTAIVGIKSRKTNEIDAQVVDTTDKHTIHPFIEQHIENSNKNKKDESTVVYTDDAKVYQSLDYQHETVCHSLSEYVKDIAHTNGIESFWAMFKRGYHGIYHHMSRKHISHYVYEFCYRHNHRGKNTIDQISMIVADMVGKQITYKQLIQSV